MRTWTTVKFVPLTLIKPRSGLIGLLADFLFPRRIKNDDPLAGCFVATSSDGKQAISADGVHWTERESNATMSNEARASCESLVDRLEV